MKVGMQDCGYYEGPASPGEKINFTCDASGRYVSITRHGGDEAHLLSLCEVEVWGHPYNYKGGLSVGKTPTNLLAEVPVDIPEPIQCKYTGLISLALLTEWNLLALYHSTVTSNTTVASDNKDYAANSSARVVTAKSASTYQSQQ